MNWAKFDSLEESLEMQKKVIKSKKILAKRNQFFTCHSCKKKSKLHSVILVQTHWYVAPYGCTGGDYWNTGERQLICPKCNALHRMIAKESRPDNYYDLSYTKQHEIDNSLKIVMEKKFGVDDWYDRKQVFDTIIYTYSENGRGEGYIVKKFGVDCEKEWNGHSYHLKRHNFNEIEEEIGIELGIINTRRFINL